MLHYIYFFLFLRIEMKNNIWISYLKKGSFIEGLGMWIVWKHVTTWDCVHCSVKVKRREKILTQVKKFLLKGKSMYVTIEDGSHTLNWITIIYGTLERRNAENGWVPIICTTWLGDRTMLVEDCPELWFWPYIIVMELSE